MAANAQHAPFPGSWRWLLLLFSVIGRRRLRKSFRAVRMLHPERLRSLPAGPVVIYLNHPSWWDPIVCAELARRLVPGRKHRAPISAASLQQYPFFRQMGMFPVEQGSARGAAQFLRTAGSVLAGNGVLWITAQGHFTDVRPRPVELKAGLGSLLQRAAGVTVLPLALEYTFWNQRLPEVLVAAGEPLTISTVRERSTAGITTHLQQALQQLQDELANTSQLRDGSLFTTLLEGRQGMAGPYAAWQRLRSTVRGEQSSADHQDHHPAVPNPGRSNTVPTTEKAS